MLNTGQNTKTAVTLTKRQAEVLEQLRLSDKPKSPQQFDASLATLNALVNAGLAERFETYSNHSYGARNQGLKQVTTYTFTALG